MDLVKEIEKAITGISADKARELIKRLEQVIEARETRGECDCGTPCEYPTSHSATDHIVLLSLKQKLLTIENS